MRKLDINNSLVGISCKMKNKKCIIFFLNIFYEIKYNLVI